MQKEYPFPATIRDSAPSHRRRKGRTLPALFILLATALVFATSLTEAVPAEQGNQVTKVLRAGYLSRVFLDVDLHDAKAALDLIVGTVSRSTGLRTSHKVVIYPDSAAMVHDLKRGELELATMPALDYLRMRNKVELTPAFVGAHNKGMGTRYVLLARRDSGIRSMADMKGKSLLILPEGRHELCHVWLDVLLRKAGATNHGEFFCLVKESTKASHAIMGLFLRQADAAVVTRSGFDASRTLNPQIERDLTILNESDYLADAVGCITAAVPDKEKAALVKAVNSLNESTYGRQLYAIFQTSGTVPFKQAFLKGLEKLLRERERLTAKAVKRN